MFVIAAIALTMALSTEMYAQNGKGNPKAPKTNWVDANNDGVCDNYTGTPKMNKGTVKPNFVDADGDGVCDNNTGTGSGKGRRTNFVDADGDGVCYNTGTAVSQRSQLRDGSGTGTQTGGGMRKRGNK